MAEQGQAAPESLGHHPAGRGLHLGAVGNVTSVLDFGKIALATGWTKLWLEIGMKHGGGNLLERLFG